MTGHTQQWAEFLWRILAPLKSSGSFVSILVGLRFYPLCVILEFLSKIPIKFSGCVIGNFAWLKTPYLGVLSLILFSINKMLCNF